MSGLYTWSEPRSTAGRPSCQEQILGQVLTPREIADMMVENLLRRRRRKRSLILDPAVGPGTFPFAMIEKGLLRDCDSLVMYDVDSEMIGRAQTLLPSGWPNLSFTNADYLDSEPEAPYDFAILNPPYIRQEWVDKKKYYLGLFKDKYGINIPGTSNLYVYFLVKTIQELSPGGFFSAIVYDSWNYTKYGNWLKSYLNSTCEQISLSSAGPQPFKDRLIDANVVLGRRRNRRTSAIHTSEMVPTKVGELSPLHGVSGMNTVRSLFDTSRGLRLKQADFFICDSEGIGRFGATPFVKKVSKIKGYVVPEDHNESALLITPTRSDELTRKELLKRLGKAREDKSSNETILNWYKERPETWLFHKEPPFAPILFNYYIRNRPRHILNPSRPYADNFYGLSPLVETDPLLILALMNSTGVALEILAHSRNQGNGLVKIQLYEYRNVLVPDWHLFSRRTKNSLIRRGQMLVDGTKKPSVLIADIDRLIANELGEERVAPAYLDTEYLNVRSHHRGSAADGLA